MILLDWTGGIYNLYIHRCDGLICLRVKLLSMHLILVQAIADGVINASIDNEKGYIHAQENTDVYSTQQPTATFHKRIEFMVDIHHQAVKVILDNRHIL